MNLESQKLHPKGKRLIVEVLPEDEKTEGGIIVIDTVAKEFSRAMVRYIGEEVDKVKIGDKVLLPFNIGRALKVDGVDMQLIFEEVIEAII